MAANRRCVPGRRAFAPRRQVAAGGIVARKAEAHRHDGDAALVVEFLAASAAASPQPVAGGIGEGRAGGVHAHARRLAEDADARGRARPQHGARLVRQRCSVGRVAADAAGARSRATSRAQSLICRSPPLAHTSSTRPSSASTTRGSFTSPRRASMRIGHVREHDALGADAVELRSRSSSSSCGSAARPRTGSIP